MRRVRISCFMIMVLCFTMLGPALFVQPVSAADPVPQIAAELSAVYNNLTVDDKSYISAARGNLQTIAANVYSTVWYDGSQPEGSRGILEPLLNASVVARFANSQNDAQAALVDFTEVLGEITYPADGDLETLQTELNAIRAAKQASFHTLFNSEATVEDFYNFLYATKQAMPDIIKNNSSYRNAVLFGSDADLKAVISPITEQAMQQTITNSVYANVYNAFYHINWDVSKLALYQRNLSAQVDPSHNAELALMKGYIRSQTKLVNATGDVEYSSTLAPGNTLKFKVLGQLMANNSVGFAVYQGETDVTSSWAATADRVVPASASGTYTIIGYRKAAENTDNIANNWLYKKDVTVTGGVTTGTVSGTIITPDSSTTTTGLAGVNVSLVGTSLSGVTDASGAFSIPNVPAGEYTLRISKTTYVQKDKSITVTAGSTVTENLATYLWGDVNGDSSVNVSDATAIVRYFVSQTAISIPEAADVTEDSSTNVSDATAIVRYFVSQTALPVNLP